MRIHYRPSRAAVLAVTSGLILTACATVTADPVPMEPAPHEATVTGPAPSGPPPVTPSAPDPDTVVAAPDVEPVAREVLWLDAELTLPAPWQLLSSEGGRLALFHPSAAGPGQGVSVVLAVPEVASAPDGLVGEERPAIFASGGPGLRMTRPGGLLLVSDTGITVSLMPADPYLLADEAVRVSEASLETVLGLLASIDPPKPPAPVERPAETARPAPTAPRPPLIQTRFGPPFPQDLPVPMIAGATLVEVTDREPRSQPSTCINRHGEVIDCADRCVDPPPGISVAMCESIRAQTDALIASDWRTLPSRDWKHRLSSGTDADLRSACESYGGRLIESGATFQHHAPSTCAVSTEKGVRMATHGGTLPDGSILSVYLYQDVPDSRAKGHCGRPCPMINVSIQFP